MRAQFIYENINFERGQDPKHSMDLGLFFPDEPWYFNAFQNPDRWEIVDRFIYKEKPILILHDKKYRDGDNYVWDTPERMMGSAGSSSSSAAANAAKKYIDNLKLQESINFERGQDPRKAMDIGLSKVVDSKLREILEEDGNDRFFILSINFYNGDGVEFVLDDIYDIKDIEDEDEGKSERDDLEEILREKELDKVFDIGEGTSQHSGGVISVVYPVKKGLEGIITDSIYVWVPSKGEVEVKNPSKQNPY
jgi:hypothetical protein